MTNPPLPADNANAEEAARQRQALLLYPGEYDGVDYKAANALDASPFEYKLMKQIIAMANGGGGTLVIGFKEGPDRRPQPDENMTSEIAATYDVTNVMRKVGNVVRGTEIPKLRVYMEQVDGVSYPVIVVQPFGLVPFFSRIDRSDENGRPILKQGSLYIRTSRASSEELATPEDWLRLLEVAASRRQDDLLGRFGDLLRQFGLSMGAQPPDRAQLRQAFEAWVAGQKAAAEHAAAEGARTLHGYALFAYQLQEGLEDVTPTELRDAMLAARRPNTGWPMGLIPQGFRNPRDRTVPDEHGIFTVIGQGDERHVELEHFDYWRLQSDGAYFLLRNLQEDWRGAPNQTGTTLNASTVVWRVAEALDHCAALYRALGVPGTTRLWFTAEYGGLLGRSLAGDRHFLASGATATQDRVQFIRNLTLDQLVADADSTVLRAVQKITSVFGFYSIPEAFVTAHLAEYRASNVW